MNNEYDIVILGAGILGCSVAAQLSKTTKYKICVIDKMPNPGLVQTSKNSGVVHSGIYYKPEYNILDYCLEGKHLVTSYCVDNNLDIKVTGKKILTTLENRFELIKRAENYNLNFHMDGDFLVLPDVALVDYLQITQHFYESCKDKVHFIFNCDDVAVGNTSIRVDNKYVFYKHKLINLTGIYANNIFRDLSSSLDYTVCEILGRYHEFKCNYNEMVYNGPNKTLPFLGVHITPTFKNTIKLGPDAFPVIVSKTISNDPTDLKRRFDFFNQNKLYFLNNLFNKSPQSMIKQSEKLLNLNLTMDQWIKYKFGVRSVLLNRNGELERNFIIQEYANTIHFLNSHSPAATCVFTITNKICSMV